LVALARSVAASICARLISPSARSAAISSLARPAINALNVFFLQANLHSSASLHGTIAMSEGIGGVLGTMACGWDWRGSTQARLSAGELCGVLKELGLAKSNPIQLSPPPL
jgi:hypothetical protein